MDDKLLFTLTNITNGKIRGFVKGFTEKWTKNISKEMSVTWKRITTIRGILFSSKKVQHAENH